MNDIATNISAGQIFGDTLYLGLDAVIDDPVLGRVADCVRQLTPAIDRAVDRHGHGATLGNHDFVPASATRTPRRALSCTYSSRDLAEPPEVHRSFRSFGPIERGVRKRCRTEAADPRSWRNALSTDYWNPPATEGQHARQRILAVIVAFTLAAILTQAGW